MHSDHVYYAAIFRISVVAAVAALGAGCTDGTSDAGAGSGEVIAPPGGIALRVNGTAQSREAPTPSGDTTIVLDLSIADGVGGAPILLSSPLFAVTANGLSVPGGAPFELSSFTSCPEGASVTAGNTYRCSIGFAVPSTSVPTEVTYSLPATANTPARMAGATFSLAACSWCGPDCVDLQTDPNNCGGCGAVAPDGCSGGQPTCPDGDTACSSTSGPACVDLSTDTDNCGACGMVAQTCTNGVPGCFAPADIACAAATVIVDSSHDTMTVPSECMDPSAGGQPVEEVVSSYPYADSSLQRCGTCDTYLFTLENDSRMPAVPWCVDGAPQCMDGTTPHELVSSGGDHIYTCN